MLYRTLLCTLVLGVATAASSAQIYINEVSTGTPDFIEIGNCSGASFDATGFVVQTWYATSGGGAPIAETPVTLPPGSIIPAQGFLILEENGTLNAPGTLPNSITVGFNYFWVAGRTLEVRITDPSGLGVDYVYKDYYGNGTTPNLPTGTNWTGNIVGTSTDDVLRRIVDVDTDDASDWGLAPGSNNTPAVLNPGQNVMICGSGASPTFQQNSPECSLTLQGVASGGYSAARSTLCSGFTGTYAVSSTLPGSIFEIGFSLLPLQPNVIATSTGQILNLDLTDPAFFFLNSGTAVPNFSVPFPGNFNVSLVAPPAAGTLSNQMLILNPASADGLGISQATQLDVVGPGGLVAGPAGTTTSTLVQFQGNPLCAPSDMPFFGTTFSAMDISSNGRILFGGADTDASPSVSEALNDSPFIGAWADFDPAAGGQIDVSLLGGGIVQVEYGTAANPLPYTRTSINNTFRILLDTISGQITLDGLGGLNTHTALMFLGISGGNRVGATDPGPASFTSGGSSFGSPTTDMHYEVGTPGSIATGVTQILFIPNGTGGYDWLAI